MTQDAESPVPYGHEESGPEKNVTTDEASFTRDDTKKTENSPPPYTQSPFTSDAFGDEEFAEVKYKTLKWWYVITSFSRPDRGSILTFSL
jgi:hypothetical protein